ncbi:MAG: hypothetical protein RIR00_2054, partial [Pseudomonadota bacterium]
MPEEITPRDAVEIKTVGIGRRIATAIGSIIAFAVPVLAATGGLEWISNNLPLLGTGLAALVTGGITSYVAVRRMGIDRAAKSMGKIAPLLLAVCGLLACTGCLTRTRCLQTNVSCEKFTINLQCNDPESMSENAYPRSIQILVQDQQVEGGSDAIASGNPTPVSVLSGDKALDAAATAVAAAINPAAGAGSAAVKAA